MTLNMRNLLIVLILSFLTISVFAQENKEYISQVKRVVDCDTLELENGEMVKLIGIACPEAETGMGKKASEFIRKLVEGKKIRLEFDVQGKDKYGRLLAYVYLATGGREVKNWANQNFPSPNENMAYVLIPRDENNSDDFAISDQFIFLNASIIKAGYASPITTPPNVKYADLFQRLYQEARKSGRGLWKVTHYRKEGESCNSDDECLKIDCSKYDTPVKEGYSPSCVRNKCKCMCYGCQ